MVILGDQLITVTLQYSTNKNVVVVVVVEDVRGTVRKAETSSRRHSGQTFRGPLH